MKTDDFRLTAYPLGELSEADTNAVQKAMAADEKIASEVAATEELGHFLTSVLANENHSMKLGVERRREIFAVGRRPDAKVLVGTAKRKIWWQSAKAVAGMAAIVVFGLWALSQTKVGEGASPQVLHDEKRAIMVTENVQIAKEAPELGMAVAREGLEENWKARVPVSGEEIYLTQPMGMRIPLVGEPNLKDYESTSLEKVRVFVEEWVNLSPAPSAPEVKLGSVGLNIELGNCRWGNDRKLILVTVSDLVKDGVNPALDLRLILEGEKVETVKMVATSGAVGELQKPQILADGETVSVLYEVKLRSAEGRIAALDLSLGNRSAYLPLMMGDEGTESSTSFEMAVLFARFAMWHENKVLSLTQIADEARGFLQRSNLSSQTRYGLDLILITEERLSLIDRLQEE